MVTLAAMVTQAATWHRDCHGHCIERVWHWVVAAWCGLAVQLLVTTVGLSWLLLLSMVVASGINTLGSIWMLLIMSVVGCCQSQGSSAACGGGAATTLSVAAGSLCGCCLSDSGPTLSIGPVVGGAVAGAVLCVPFVFPCSTIISCSSAVT